MCTKLLAWKASYCGSCLSAYGFLGNFKGLAVPRSDLTLVVFDSLTFSLSSVVSEYTRPTVRDSTAVTEFGNLLWWPVRTMLAMVW